jgi:hypothetical protein
MNSYPVWYQKSLILVLYCSQLILLFKLLSGENHVPPQLLRITGILVALSRILDHELCMYGVVNIYTSIQQNAYEGLTYIRSIAAICRNMGLYSSWKRYWQHTQSMRTRLLSPTSVRMGVLR